MAASHRAAGLVNRLFARAGYRIVRTAPAAPSSPALPPDFDDQMAATIEAVRPYTMTSPERIFMLCEGVRYVVRAGVPGAFVECGVWRGGSSLAVVRTLLSLGQTDRDIYLFDTFDSMPPPGPEDRDFRGVAATVHHEALAAGGTHDPAYDYLPYAEVQRLFRATGYPKERLHFVPGLVEDTVPGQAPEQIALLRLDTDYYQSTVHELHHLYPRLPSGAVLIIDDYGHYLGARQATDEFLAELAQDGSHLLLGRIDYTGRIAVVPGPTSGR